MRTLFLLVMLLASSLSVNVQRVVDPTFPDTLDRKQLRHTLVGQGVFFVGGLSYLDSNWYLDRERVPFNFYNDAAGYLQVDKAGHAFGAYGYSYWGYRTLRQAGVSTRKALIYGGGLGLYFQTPIEVFDGLYEG